MAREKKVAACDCETDPFRHGRVPKPFVWGLYDGSKFYKFDKTEELVAFLKTKEWIVYAHNGGKFDFMYFLPFISATKAQIINGRIVSFFIGMCEMRDSFAIIPEKLETFGGKKEIDYAKLEEDVRAAHMPEIIDYLEADCVTLYEGVTVFRREAGRQKTIAANALSFSRKLGVNPGKTNHRFDKKYRVFFFGGRTECFRGGTFKNIKIIDIHSAYPYAMTQDHATGSDFDKVGSLKGLTREQIQRAFIIIECTSRGAFPLRTPKGLEFPHEYNEFHVTGWEYLAAKDLGLISDEKILSVSVSENTINFTPYVNHWYALKSATNKKTHPKEYLTYKRMMNSLYGKLSQDPARYMDYKYVAAGTKICLSHKRDENDICKDCGEPGNAHGWELEREYGDHEIHTRPSLWKVQYEYGNEWEGKKIYNNVATGASVTGCCRAHLLRTMHAVGIEHVIYCDTDSIMCTEQGDLSQVPFTEKLGDWELEDACAPLAHFAGKKLYAIKLSEIDKETGKNKIKIACKGSKLTYDNLQDLVTGKVKEIVWQNEAPSFKIDGSATFVVRKIRATVPLPVNHTQEDELL